MTHAILTLQKITKYFQQGSSFIKVLNDISVSFAQGKTYAVMGVSGAGKSTLMHIIAGLDKPSSGLALFNNQPLSDFSPDQQNNFLNQSIGLLFQCPYLINELSVIENIIIPGLIAQKNWNNCKKRALLLLEKVGIVEKAHYKPASLSGGQQQRAALARALFNQPTFLLADEPTGSLDIVTGKEIINLLLSCQQEWGMGIIISSHDDYVIQTMEVTYQLKEGKLVKKE
ncbi:MAG: ABC transporter ATP-binding protein [Candidatus Babeliales bacterium]